MPALIDPVFGDVVPAVPDIDPAMVQQILQGQEPIKRSRVQGGGVSPFGLQLGAVLPPGADEAKGNVSYTAAGPQVYTPPPQGPSPGPTSLAQVITGSQAPVGPPGRMTAQEVSDRLTPATLNDFNASDLNRWLRGGLTGNAGPLRDRENLLAQMRANIETKAKETQAENTGGVPLDKMLQAAEVQWLQNNPGATEENKKDLRADLNEVRQRYAKSAKPSPGAAPIPGAPTPQTLAEPVSEAKTPPSWQPFARTLDTAREVEKRDETGMPIVTADAKGRKEIAKTNRKPGEFLMQLDAQKPGFVRQNLPAIVQYMREKYSPEMMDAWFKEPIGRHLPWVDIPADEQGKAALLSLLQERGAARPLSQQERVRKALNLD